jgi:hypothetical protein
MLPHNKRIGNRRRDTGLLHILLLWFRLRMWDPGSFLVAALRFLVSRSRRER